MQKDADIINIIVNETNESESAKNENKTSFVFGTLKNALHKIKCFICNFFDGISPLFIKLSCMICVGIIFISLGLGFIIPKTDTVLSNSLEKLHRTDQSYLSAKNEYDNAEKEISALTKELETKQENMNKMDKTQDSLDKITQENDSLSKEKENIQNDVDAKQRTLDNLEQAVSSSEKSSVVLSSGTYKAGKNIATGKYTVTGTGSIVISNSGSARVNTRLKSEGASYTILDDDTIKIDGNAKFIPE